MRAVVVTRPGDPDVLAIERRPDPEPGPGQVRVRVRAFGVNRADLLQRRGAYPAPPGWPADIPGLEFAGEIDVPGDGVTTWAPGVRVMGIAGGGACAESVVVPAAHLLPIPDGMAFTDAAAVPEVFITAHDALERLAVVADEWVLVHAVGSGVGTAALQLVHLRGASCIGTSRTPAKLRAAAAMGLDAGVDTTREDWPVTVRRMVVGGVHAALDLVGGELFPQTLETLRERGRLVLVGLTAGRDVHLDLSIILRGRLRIEGTVLRSRSNEEKAALVRSFAERVLPHFGEGRLRPVVDRVFRFDDVVDAHRLMEGNATFGKLVVEVG
jgi:putative PIG3 family NAD(P)H quinone oxidoreductase